MSTNERTTASGSKFFEVCINRKFTIVDFISEAGVTTLQIGWLLISWGTI